MTRGVANPWTASFAPPLMLLVCHPRREQTQRSCCGGFRLRSSVCRPRRSSARVSLLPASPMRKRPTSRWWMSCSARLILASSSLAIGWMRCATRTLMATNGTCQQRARTNTATTSSAPSMAMWVTISSFVSKSLETCSRSSVWMLLYKSTRASSARCFTISASTATAAVSMRTASIRKW